MNGERMDDPRARRTNRYGLIRDVSLKKNATSALVDVTYQKYSSPSLEGGFPKDVNPTEPRWGGARCELG